MQNGLTGDKMRDRNSEVGLAEGLFSDSAYAMGVEMGEEVEDPTGSLSQMA
jgi:hypothetical protein